MNEGSCVIHGQHRTAGSIADEIERLQAEVERLHGILQNISADAANPDANPEQALEAIGRELQRTEPLWCGSTKDTTTKCERPTADCPDDWHNEHEHGSRCPGCGEFCQPLLVTEKGNHS